MKFTLSWLKEHLDTNASLDEILERLTAIGLEVEESTNPGDVLKGFVIAEVKNVEKHPNADKLNVCEVFTGSETFHVVCGAPNVKKGMKGVFGREGMYVPGADFTLKKTKIRDVESCGMLCSEKELCLSEAHEGIIDLPADAPVGTDYVDYAGLNDPIIEIALTPDRGDCAGVHGIARDLAASGLGTLIAPDFSPVEGKYKSDKKVILTDDAKDRCYQFASRMIKNVKNAESPDWLKKRLENIGLRPISALVDITNFFTFDLGRPLHVFDADKVKGDLKLRNAVKGEKIDALDDKSYTMQGAELVIQDDEGLEGLAGIIGASRTGCTLDTTNVYLECALFDPSEVATTGRKHNVESDARYRFERGVDPSSVVWGAEMGTKMILDLCGGEPSELQVTGEGRPDHENEIRYKPSLLMKLVGLHVDEDKQEEILVKLGFQVDSSELEWVIKTPSWRYDVMGAADITEEIARIIGYDHIPTRSFHRDHALTQPALSGVQRRRQRVRRLLAARGLHEAVTWSFMSSSKACFFTDHKDEALKLLNPISTDLDMMRPSMIGNLLQAVQRNMDRSFKNFGIFEVGPIYDMKADMAQHNAVAGLRAGNALPRHVQGEARKVDTYDAKADLFAAILECGMDPLKLQIKTENLPCHFHPGRSGSVSMGNKLIGHFGEIHPFVVQKFGLKGTVVGFEFLIDALPVPKEKAMKKAVEMNPLQPVERDFAFVLEEGISADQLLRAVRKADKKFLKDVKLFDVYQGKGLEENQKSVALTVMLQPVEKSFTDQEIDEISQNIINIVSAETGGVLRG